MQASRREKSVWGFSLSGRRSPTKADDVPGGAASSGGVRRALTLKEIEALSSEELDKELELMLTESDLNLNDKARTNLLWSTSYAGKLLLLKQYTLKKDGYFERPDAPKVIPQETLKLNRVTQAPASDPDVPPQPCGVTPAEYVAMLADRNTTLKNLSRCVSALRGDLALSPRAYAGSFAAAEGILSLQRIDGVGALGIALRRIAQAREPQLVAGGTTPSAVVPSKEETIMHVLECLGILIGTDVGIKQMVGNAALIKEVVYCLGMGPKSAKEGSVQAWTGGLKVRIKALEVLCAVCLITEDVSSTVLQSMTNLSVLQLESARFVNLIKSLHAPLPSAAEDVVADYGALVSNYQTALLSFLITLVASPSDPCERLRIRTELENAGLHQAFEMFADSPCQSIQERISLYKEDLEEDLEELETTYKRENEQLKDYNDLATTLQLEASRQRQPERCKFLAAAILEKLTSVMASGPADRIIDPVNTLLLLERIISGILLEQSRTPKPKQRTVRVQNLARDIIKAIEQSTGVPLNVTVAATSHGQPQATAADENVVLELEAQLRASEAKVSGLQQEIDGLRKDLENNGVRSAQEAAVGASVKEELRLLKQAVYLLKEEREISAKMQRERDVIERETLEALLKAKRGMMGRAGTPRGVSSPSKGVEGGDATSVTELTREPSIKSINESQTTAPAAPAPPPPPPMMALSALPKITTATPSVRMKPLRWKKLTNDEIASSTLWSSLAAATYCNEPSLPRTVIDAVEESQFPLLFAEANQAKSAAVTANYNGKPTKVTLIEARRDIMYEIMLRGLPISTQALKEAILKVDDSFLTLERLNTLMQCVPNEEEIDAVRAYDGDVQQLGNAERYVLVVSTVPRLHQRLQSMIFRQKFNEIVAEAGPQLATIRDAVEAISRSDSLATIMRYVLVIGNYMNAGTFRGQALGFRVEVLGRLQETKSNDVGVCRARAPTLLHYVARRMEELNQSLSGLQGLKPVEAAARMPISELLATIKSLAAGIEAIQKLLAEFVKDEKADGDWFHEVMESFALTADVRLKSIVDAASGIEKELDDLLETFGESRVTKELSYQEFFKIIWKLRGGLLKANDENHSAELLTKNMSLNFPLSRREGGPGVTQGDIHITITGMEKLLSHEPATTASARAKIAVPCVLGDSGEEDDDLSRAVLEEAGTLKRIMTTRKTLRRVAVKGGSDATLMTEDVSSA
ncbi:hypothetical protein HK101_000443 [Irineochytrium annulatum]|nr:hypothetical protein HK101_000443 [Irineochytrium annulatum]